MSKIAERLQVATVMFMALLVVIGLVAFVLLALGYVSFDVQA